ncbi:MAG: methyltransferase domain-containing protein [Planctomycetaceae bacterium]|nr:methyltransferase domain-containing protein [Planctomycetaceae bacterium]
MNSSGDSKSILLPEAYQHYNLIDEANRLSGIHGQLELIRTRELLTRFLPKPPAYIVDVGGGAGIHSFWLAEQGYDVHLIDAVPHHIENAKETARQLSHVPVVIEVGDARTLPLNDGMADAVLLFGPLYHLTSRDERVQCIAEARRILRSNGVAMGVGIPSFASLVNCLSDGALSDTYFRSIVDGDLNDGQHRNPNADPRFFTTTFFHHPDELVEEFAAGGFEEQRLIAVEGPGKLLHNFEECWNVSEHREWLLDVIRRVEEEPHLFGVSTHLMTVAKC